MQKLVLVLAATAALTGSARAQLVPEGGGGPAVPGFSSVTITGNEVRGDVSLSATLTAELVLSFENAVGLNLQNLGMSAAVVDAADPALLARLPAVGLAAGFPVLVTVAPPANGGLSFSGVYSLSLHTHALEFTANCPLRLYTAHDGGNFEDMTETIGMGSYRVRGTGGSFSEFLIVSDLRPIAAVTSAKFDALENLLARYGDSIPDAVRGTLEDQLIAARVAYLSGSAVEAVRQLDLFVGTVRANSGSAIPDVWRASGDLVNIAGLLRSAASTLRFSINLGS
jgi:hypothetical protein